MAGQIFDVRSLFQATKFYANCFLSELNVFSTRPTALGRITSMPREENGFQSGKQNNSKMPRSNEKIQMSFKNYYSSFNLFAVMSVVALVLFSGCYFMKLDSNSCNLPSYEIIKSRWTTLTSWKFPQDAFEESGEDEILWANIYQIALAALAFLLAMYIDAKPTFVAAMFTFTIFGLCHITAHATLHPWTYLPLHYSFVATGLLVGMTFGGITSYKTIIVCLFVDFILIQGIGQFFGVLSAFGIMVFGLRHHVRLMCILALGCGLIWFGLLFNDVLYHGAHGTTEICACIGLTLGGTALILDPNARKCNKSILSKN